MSGEAVGLTEEELSEVRDRPFVESYSIHDIGYEILVSRLNAHGYRVEDHGTDDRYADEVKYGEGPDLVVYEQRDFVRKNEDGLGSTYIDERTGQFVPEEFVYEKKGYIEIKTKQDPEWFGRVNLRHLREYVNFANEVDVPVFLWFALVDDDDTIPMVHREGFLEVEDMDQIDGDVVEVSDETVVFHAEDLHSVDDGLVAVEGSDIIEVRARDTVVDEIPNVHGNRVVELNDDEFRSFPHFMYEIDNA